MALIDVFDTRIWRPIYNADLGFAAAHNLILSGPDRRFDPDVTMPSFSPVTTAWLLPESSPIPRKGNPAGTADLARP